MAKQSSIQKNNKRKLMVKKFRDKRLNLKKKINDRDISMEDRFKLQLIINDLPRDGSRVRVRNRCEITGRARGFYSKFGLSRIKIRELGMAGLLPGVVKSSW